MPAREDAKGHRACAMSRCTAPVSEGQATLWPGCGALGDVRLEIDQLSTATRA